MLAFAPFVHAGQSSIFAFYSSDQEMVQSCLNEGMILLRTKLEVYMSRIIACLWSEENGQDIAEYAVMLAVILVIVVGTIRLVGSNANNVFSSVASSVQ